MRLFLCLALAGCGGADFNAIDPVSSLASDAQASDAGRAIDGVAPNAPDDVATSLETSKQEDAATPDVIVAEDATPDVVSPVDTGSDACVGEVIKAGCGGWSFEPPSPCDNNVQHPGYNYWYWCHADICMPQGCIPSTGAPTGANAFCCQD